MAETTDFTKLRASLVGELLLPADPGYDGARAIWNAMIDRRPAAIARCLGASDVMECFRFARSTGIPFSIRGGGHNIAGLSLVDDGLLIDLSRMRGVHVRPAEGIAHAQAGCVLGDVDRETQLHGLAPVLGFVSKTGIAGLTLGGGFGYLTRRFGWTCDTVLGMDIVTADGTLRRASADENPDLFWALRGGGGNFGIVTSIDYRLFPVGPEIFGGAIAWAADAAPEVLGLYRELVETAPPETTIVAALRPAPPAPWLDPAIHRKPMVALFVCHTGSMGSVEPLVARIRSIGRPVGDILQPRSYVSQQALLDATQPSGRRYYWKSEYLGGLADGFLSRSIAGTREFASPQSALLIFPLQGRLNELPGDDGAVGNRDAHFVVNIAGSWEMPADDARNIDWTRGLWENLREFSTGGTYVNFLTEDEPVSRLRSAYGSNYERLAESKRKWDPENVFRTNKNIAPGE